MNDTVVVEDEMSFLTKLWSDYRGLDKGIRFAVKVLHARGIETCQSCQGGEGHSYDRPTIDLPATSRDAAGFAALAALHDFGLPVRDVSLVWPVHEGAPYEKLWRITFSSTMEDRADDEPIFEYCYRPRRDVLLRKPKGDPA